MRRVCIPRAVVTQLQWIAVSASASPISFFISREPRVIARKSTSIQLLDCMEHIIHRSELQHACAITIRPGEGALALLGKVCTQAFQFLPSHVFGQVLNFDSVLAFLL